MPRSNSFRYLIAAATVALALIPASAAAEEIKASAANPTFGHRTDNSDGSSAMTIGRQLPTDWDTRIGTDVSLAAPASPVPSDNILRGTAPDRSTGSVWGNLTMPGLRPLGFDKAALEARLDAGKDQGKLGAILSRSMPLGRDLSVTLQNSYSVTQPLATAAPAAPVAIALAASPAAGTATAAPASPTWAADESLRLNINSSGTTLAAGAGSSTLDDQWHSKFSVEQTLLGPLKVTTSVEDAGTVASKKSITAGFKRVW